MADQVAIFFEAIRSSNLQKVTSLLSSTPFLARSKVPKEFLRVDGEERKVGLLPMSSLVWNAGLEIKRGCECFGEHSGTVDGVQLALLLLLNDEHNKFEKKEIARQLIKVNKAN